MTLEGAAFSTTSVGLILPIYMAILDILKQKVIESLLYFLAWAMTRSMYELNDPFPMLCLLTNYHTNLIY